MSDAQDAKRYRWLRDTGGMPFRNTCSENVEVGMIDCIMVCDMAGEDGTAISLDDRDMDAAVDAAMARWPK